MSAEKPYSYEIVNHFRLIEMAGCGFTLATYSLILLVINTGLYLLIVLPKVQGLIAGIGCPFMFAFIWHWMLLSLYFEMHCNGALHINKIFVYYNCWWFLQNGKPTCHFLSGELEVLCREHAATCLGSVPEGSDLAKMVEWIQKRNGTYRANTKQLEEV